MGDTLAKATVALRWNDGHVAFSEAVLLIVTGDLGPRWGNRLF